MPFQSSEISDWVASGCNKRLYSSLCTPTFLPSKQTNGLYIREQIGEDCRRWGCLECLIITTDVGCCPGSYPWVRLSPSRHGTCQDPEVPL